MGRSKELRFAAPALPAAALLLAGALDILTRKSPLRAWVFAAALILPADLFAQQTFGVSLLPPSRFAPAATVYGGPPRPAPRWDAEALTKELENRIQGPAVVVVGAEHAQINANLMAAWAERDGSPLTFIHYGHMEDRIERTLSRLAEKDATHILFLTGIPADEAPPGIPLLEAALKALILPGELPFRRVASFSAGPDLEAELWERTGPIRMVGIIRP